MVPLLRHSVRQFGHDRVIASDGPAGSVADIYFEDEGWKARYLVVKTGGWLTSNLVLIAPALVDLPASSEGSVRLQLSRDDIRHAPGPDSAPPVFRQLQLERAVRLGYPYYWSDLALWGAVGGGSRADAERAAHALAHGDPHLRSARALIGCRVEARDGPLGEVDDFIVDTRTWSMSELVIHAHRWSPRGRVRTSLAVVERIDWSARKLHLATARA